MQKQKALRALNEKIDRLILTGLVTEAQQQAFRRLTRLHKQLITRS